MHSDDSIFWANLVTASIGDDVAVAEIELIATVMRKSYYAAVGTNPYRHTVILSAMLVWSVRAILKLRRDSGL